MMRKKLFLTLALFFIPILAQAGSFEDGVYTSNLGYSFTPPSQWQCYDAANAEGLKNAVPKNLSSTNFMHTDVVFFPPFGSKVDTLEADRARVEELKANEDLIDPDAPEPIPIKVEAPSFSPSISVMVLKHTPSKADVETAKNISDHVGEDIGDIVSNVSNFKINKSTFDRKSDLDRFDYQMSYNYRSREIDIEQSLYLFDDRSILITCTSDANDHTDAEPNWCAKAIDSFRF